MDSLQALGQIVGNTRVQERNGGNRGSADAFRRALQQQAGDQADADRSGDRPMRTRLQRRAVDDRKDDGAFHHVDVIA